MSVKQNERNLKKKKRRKMSVKKKECDIRTKVKIIYMGMKKT